LQVAPHCTEVAEGADVCEVFKIPKGEAAAYFGEHFKAFDASFIAEDVGAGAAKKIAKKADKGKDVGIPNLVLDEIIQKENGGVVVVGEQFWVSTETVQSANGTRTTTRYNYHDIVLVSVNAEGNIEWNVKVPKRQLAAAPGRSRPYTANFKSYTSVIVGASIYLIFNDNPKNMAYAGDGKIVPLNLKEPLVVITEIYSDGRVFKNPLLSKCRGKNVIAQPMNSEQISGNEMMMYMERKKAKSFVFIELDK
jgi:hypothetical protein